MADLAKAALVCVCVVSEHKSVHVFSWGEMDEGRLGALGVLIIHCSVVGSELAISSWLYPCLMI